MVLITSYDYSLIMFDPKYLEHCKKRFWGCSSLHNNSHRGYFFRHQFTPCSFKVVPPFTIAIAIKVYNIYNDSN